MFQRLSWNNLNSHYKTAIDIHPESIHLPAKAKPEFPSIYTKHISYHDKLPSVLPKAFQTRIVEQLGQIEAKQLFNALEAPVVAGLRVNTTKISNTQLMAKIPFQLEPVPWSQAGFIVDKNARAAKHAFHAAGLYYMQEPSAMSVAEVVAPQVGELILDLAAAPGGKSTHLVALSQHKATVISNDVNRQRCRALIENLERWGAKQSIILNEKVDRLSHTWGAIFDKVLLDAPCSGEGMFRKSKDALDMWSGSNIQQCALRQKELIDDAAKLVKVGGKLIYSTCTFAPEENEQVIEAFLQRHPEFSLEPLDLSGLSSTAEGFLRLWPHKLKGEGHFVACLVKQDGETSKLKLHKFKEASKKEKQGWLEFAQGTGLENYAKDKVVSLFGDHLYVLPETVPDLSSFNSLRHGLHLGTLKKGRFEPAHALALAIHKDHAKTFNHLNLDAQNPALSSYLKGDVLEASGEKGWLLLCVDGFPLAWGKRSGSVIKNAIPKGLRKLN